MVEWHDRFLIGNPRIDFEHRIFFDLISHYGEARRAGAPTERLIRILDEVALYARFHFKSEENLMQDIGYPWLADHKEQHHQLTNELSNNLAGLKIGLYATDRVEEFLMDWFIAHVTNDDARISRFIASPG
jgi:hemerythrin